MPVAGANTFYQTDDGMQYPAVSPVVGAGTIVPQVAPVMGPAVRGYSNVADSQDNYYTAPVHAQYWTGSPYQGPYQQYPQQINGGYYPQPYPAVNPGFDAQYWTGHYIPYPAQQYYGPQPYPSRYSQYQQTYPYGTGAGYYAGRPAHPGMYYPHHAPLPMKPYNKGKGSIAKTLLGAAVVGVVAGAVARG